MHLKHIYAFHSSQICCLAKPAIKNMAKHGQAKIMILLLKALVPEKIDLMKEFNNISIHTSSTFCCQLDKCQIDRLLAQVLLELKTKKTKNLFYRHFHRRHRQFSLKL